MESFFDEVVCYQCGKSIIIPDRGQWIYKRSINDRTGPRMKYFCGWSCVQAWENSKQDGRTKVSKKHKSKAE